MSGAASFEHDLLPPVILRHSVNLLAGAPGTGKTTFLASFVKQIQLQQPIFTLAPSPTPVYQAYIAADRSWDDSTRKWFDVAEVEIPHYSLQDDRSFKKSRLRRKQDRIAIFEECVHRLSPSGDGTFPNPTIIYVDPLALFLGGNLLDYDTCLVACSELREICIDRGIAIIGTAHASKQKSDKNERYLRLQDRILGSAALFGYTDTQLYLASPEETGNASGVYTFLWAPHHAKAEMFPMVRGEHGLFQPADGVTLEEDEDGAEGPATTVPYDAEWMLPFLAEPKEFADILAAAEAEGMKRSTVNRRLRVLKDLGKIRVVARGTYQVSEPS